MKKKPLKLSKPNIGRILGAALIHKSVWEASSMVRGWGRRSSGYAYGMALKPDEIDIFWQLSSDSRAASTVEAERLCEVRLETIFNALTAHFAVTKVFGKTNADAHLVVRARKP